MTEKHYGEVRLYLPRSTGFTLKADIKVPGEGITVLFGPSGCGKTTVLRCVAGLERAQGLVRIGEEVWQDDERQIFRPTYERSLGYVFQEASLFAHLNVEKNLTFGLERAKVPDGRKRLDEAVELLGIGHLLGRRVSELSGGERQRCAIARALCLRPDILLMDEPLAALDFARKREILPWLEKLRSELRVPILYVTHSADEMARLADNLVVMAEGSVRASGRLADVLGNVRLPLDMEEGTSVVLKGTVESVSAEWRSALIRTDGWIIDAVASGVAPGGKLRLRVLARDVSIALERPENLSIRNVLPATVEEIGAPSGAENAYQLVKLKSRGGRDVVLARILRESAAALSLRPGLPVWALVKAAAVIL